VTLKLIIIVTYLWLASLELADDHEECHFPPRSEMDLVLKGLSPMPGADVGHAL